jgi:hypothetical protein
VSDLRLFSCPLPSARCFPCRRCQRLGFPCTDPQESREPEDPTVHRLMHEGKTIDEAMGALPRAEGGED